MVKGISYTVGIILVVVGVVGFFNDPVIGLFEVDLAHNLLLIVLGAVLLGAAWQNKASMGAKIVGVVTAIVAVLGYIPPTTDVLGFIETNLASSVLQTVVALVLLYAGFMAKEERGIGTPPSAPQTPLENERGGPGPASSV